MTMIDFTRVGPLATPVSTPDAFVAAQLAVAQAGDHGAFYQLGIAYSTGCSGLPCDLVEAHCWFNLAAAQGHEEAARCRADIADEMTAREIAEAQRRAREWLRNGERRAA